MLSGVPTRNSVFSSLLSDVHGTSVCAARTSRPMNCGSAKGVGLWHTAIVNVKQGTLAFIARHHCVIDIIPQVTGRIIGELVLRDVVTSLILNFFSTYLAVANGFSPFPLGSTAMRINIMVLVDCRSICRGFRKPVPMIFNLSLLLCNNYYVS